MAYVENYEDEVYSNIKNPFTNFEGASTTYLNGLRGINNGQADELAARELAFLQSRSAHVCRNNGYAKSALKNWITNASYIAVRWKDSNGKKHSMMQDYWDEFVENPSYDSFGDMKTFQSVSNSSQFITGNTYIRCLIVREGNTNKIPLKLQLIPSSLHDINYNNYPPTPDGKLVRYGIGFKDSIPIEYYFKQSNLDPKINTYYHTVVPSNELIHYFIREEPGQWLGIPILSSVLLSLYSLDDLITATISKQKAAQSIAIIVEKTGQALNLLPVASTETVTNTKNTETKTIFKADSRESQVIYGEKGETLKMFQGTDIGANFNVVIEQELRKIATVADALYHQLTGDTQGMNYSSLLGLAIQSRNRLEYIYNFVFIPLRDRPIAMKFKELAMLYNSKTASAIPYFQLPRWRGIDGLKDAQEDLLELQNGLGLIPDKLAERGLSIEDILADEDNRKALEGLGIFLNTSGANPSMAQAGNTQANSNSTST